MYSKWCSTKQCKLKALVTNLCAFSQEAVNDVLVPTADGAVDLRYFYITTCQVCGYDKQQYTVTIKHRLQSVRTFTGLTL